MALNNYHFKYIDSCHVELKEQFPNQREFVSRLYVSPFLFQCT